MSVFAPRLRLLFLLSFPQGICVSRSFRARLVANLCIMYIRISEYSNLRGHLLPDSIRRLKASIFQALGHPTRIAILELLDRGEVSAGALIKELGMEQANVSQHLAVLRAQQIVVTRKSSNQVFYSVRDPVILKVLALLRRYLQKHLKETLNDLDRDLQETGR
jgi:DNA-binding transcriptional ArsR family regulator